MQDVHTSRLRTRIAITRCLVALGAGVIAVACSDPSTAPQPRVSEALGSPAGIAGGKIFLGGGPWGVDVSNNGLVYVTQLGSGQVAVSSISAQTISAEIGVGTVPTGVVFAPNGRTAYVANQFDGTLGVIDVASGVQIATIPLPNGALPFAVAVSPDGNQIFIASNQTSVFVADAHTLAIVDAIPVDEAPNAFALSPNGKHFFVSSFAGATVTEFSIASHAVVRTYSTGGAPQGLTTNKKGNELYVVNESGYVTLFSTATGAILRILTLAAGGFGAAVTADDVHLYITEPDIGIVQIVNLQNRKMQGAINVGGQPRRVAFNSTGKVGVVANQDGYITFIK
ncbi:MAG TPA: beta-propeller fold lactonase family protein [Gemmatimonadaceae bacterium]|nr:beta-propeller fold lactonase family protein [Gemmatimonadaceae bacterium]